MTDMTGHNKPPANHELSLSEAKYLAERAEKLVIKSAEDAATATLMLDEELKTRQASERAFKEEKDPITAQGRAVDAAWKPVMDTLQTAKATIKGLLLGWDKAERDRLAREAEEARLASEKAQEAAMAALANQEALDPWEVEAKVSQADELAASAVQAEAITTTRTVFVAAGTRARSVKLVYSADITDAKAMTVALADHPAVQEAAAKVAQNTARTMKEAFKLAGCKLKTTETL
jgi:hypothetical protein